MSNRPPATYILPIADQAAYDAAFGPTGRFGGQSVVCIGPAHHLQAIEVAVDGVLAGHWLEPPTGADANFALNVRAGVYEVAPATIDMATTTCGPLKLLYGRLGYGAR